MHGGMRTFGKYNVMRHILISWNWTEHTSFYVLNKESPPSSWHLGMNKLSPSMHHVADAGEASLGLLDSWALCCGYYISSGGGAVCLLVCAFPCSLTSSCQSPRALHGVPVTQPQNGCCDGDNSGRMGPYFPCQTSRAMPEWLPTSVPSLRTGHGEGLRGRKMQME